MYELAKRTDLVIVGCTLGNLVHAHYAASKGLNVVVVEKQAEVGGAWRVERGVFGSDVECAAHFFQSSLNPQSVAALEQLGAEFISVPVTKWHVRFCKKSFLISDFKAKLFIEFKSLTLSLAGFCLARIRAQEFVRLSKDRFKNIAFLFCKYRDATVYFRGGVQPFLERLLKRLEILGVEFIKDKVKTIDIKNGEALVSCENYSLISKHISLTRRSLLEKVSIGSDVFTLDEQFVVRRQVFLLVEDRKQELNFYVRRSHNCGFFAVSNLSLIENFTDPEGRVLLVVTLEDMSAKAPELSGEHVMGMLRKHKVLSPDVKLVGSHCARYEDARSSQDTLEQICSDVKNIELEESLDFAPWVNDIVSRYQA